MKQIIDLLIKKYKLQFESWTNKHKCVVFTHCLAHRLDIVF